MVASGYAYAVGRYTVTGLEFFPGTNGGLASSINDSGRISGMSGDRAIVWYRGTMTVLPALGEGNFPTFNAINSRGEVVGNIGPWATLWSNGVLSILNDRPGGERYSHIYATGINASGVVSAYGFIGDLQHHPLVIDANGVTELPLSAGATQGAAFAISNSGYIAGTNFVTAVLWSSLTDVPHEMTAAGAHAVNEHGDAAGAVLGRFGEDDAYRATVWPRSGGVIVADPLPGMRKNFAYGMNDSLQVVGGSVPEFNYQPNLVYYYSSSQRAFLWEEGVTYDLNALIPNDSGWVLSYARDINNNGEIVGVGLDPEGHVRGFLLTPVPEPGIHLLSLVGLCVVILFAGYRSRGA
jgi:uncharacterized membrane protein